MKLFDGNEPIITSRFGDNWKEYAKEKIDVDTLIDIAWGQGRQVIQYERLMDDLFEVLKLSEHMICDLCTPINGCIDCDGLKVKKSIKIINKRIKERAI